MTAVANANLREGILNSIILIGGGADNGGYTLGVAQGIEYLTALAQDGATSEFVEAYASFALHLMWVETPQEVLDCAMLMVEESMQDNKVSGRYLRRLVTEGVERVAFILEQKPVAHSAGFTLKDGSLVEGEQLLGLSGVQFVIDVSDLTCDDTDDYLDDVEPIYVH